MAVLITLTHLQSVLHSLAIPGFLVSANGAFVYPLVIAAFIVTCLASATLLIREVGSDRRGGDSFASALISNGAMTAVYFVIELVSIGVLWLAYATPADRLPFWAPPAPGDLWATPYLVTAVIIHGAIAYLALLFLVGLWLAQLGVGNTSRFFALGVLAANVVAVVGWEAVHLPLWFLVYGELLVMTSTSDTIITVLMPTTTTRKGLLRAQNLGAILYVAAGVVVIWLAHRLPLPTTSLGVLTRQPNPLLYTLALGAIGLCAALSSLYILVNPQPRRVSFNVPSNPGPQTLLNVFVFEIPAVYLLWLTFTTPPTSLPFPAPGPGSVWLWVLPGPVAYATLGALLHGVVSFLLIQGVLGFWLGALNIRNGTKLFQLGILVSFVVMTLGWEAQHWPVAFLIPAEAVLAFFVYTTITGLFEKLLETGSFENPLAFRRARRLATTVEYLAVMAALTFIVFAHDIGFFPLNLLLLYLALVLLDPVAANIASAIHPQNSSSMLLSPRRWQYTLIITLPLILLGASGLFAPLSANSGLSFDLWIEAGMAAALFLLFNPLIDLARYVGGKRATQPGDADLVELLRGRLGELISGTATLAQRGAHRATGDQSGAEPDEPLLGKRDKAALETVERQVAEQLKFPTGIIFFIAALAFHLLITLFNFSSILNSSLVPLVFGLVGLVAALLPLVNNRALETTRYISLLLLFVTIVVTGISVLFTVNPQTQTTVTLAGQSATALLTNQAFYTMALRLGLQEALFLLTIGQLGYLYRVINANITFEQDLARDPDADGWNELADDYYAKGRMDQALEAYRRAFACDPENLWLLRRQGFIYESQDRYQEALQVYEDLITRKRDETSYWSDKGDALMGLDRAADALTAYEQAITLDTRNGYAWNGKGSALGTLNRNAEALDAFQRATALVADNAVFWTRLGIIQATLQHYDDALRAYDRATSLDASRAIAWFRKGGLLNVMGRYQEAHAALEKGLALDATVADAWIEDGVALLRLERASDALAAFQQAVTLDSTNSRALNGKGIALYALDRYAEALDAYTAALASEPNAAYIWDNQGDALAALRRGDEALAAYNHALSLDPENATYLRDKATLLRQLGRDAEAAEAEAHIAALAPTRPYSQ